jgi:hypothetical protein
MEVSWLQRALINPLSPAARLENKARGHRRTYPRTRKTAPQATDRFENLGDRSDVPVYIFVTV